jgi:hypothetical protein
METELELKIDQPDLARLRQGPRPAHSAMRTQLRPPRLARYSA